MYRYIKCVASAQYGCVTDEWTKCVVLGSMRRQLMQFEYLKLTSQLILESIWQLRTFSGRCIEDILMQLLFTVVSRAQLGFDLLESIVFLKRGILRFWVLKFEQSAWKR
jgi:hypothetical protein